eukprot:2309665-Rhodomonas_salina.4
MSTRETKRAGRFCGIATYAMYAESPQPSSCFGATGWLAVAFAPMTTSIFPRAEGRVHVAESIVAAILGPSSRGRTWLADGKHEEEVICGFFREMLPSPVKALEKAVAGAASCCESSTVNTTLTPVARMLIVKMLPATEVISPFLDNETQTLPHSTEVPQQQAGGKCAFREEKQGFVVWPFIGWPPCTSPQQFQD